MNDQTTSLFERTLDCLLLNDPQEKVSATLALQQDWQAEKLVLIAHSEVKPLTIPGRPARPELVDPREVPRRTLSSLKGRLTLAHAIAHIEFNAINLALDALYRFRDMPAQYYTDWLKVAAEEAKHFTLLADYLSNHDVQYGDMTAHNGLWEMAVKTGSDVIIRMALVPRVLEARGLDVTPTMISKLQSTGDIQLINILQTIFDEEIGHVKIGTYWYKSLCDERKLDANKYFFQLIAKYMQGAKFGPFETSARLQAGFSHEEMQGLLKHF